MEELVTLQYGNFTILVKWIRDYTQRAGCSNRVANQALQFQLFLNETRMIMAGLEHHPTTRMGSIPAGGPAPQCDHHVEERASMALPWITIGSG